jgi:hypothetical protein
MITLLFTLILLIVIVASSYGQSGIGFTANNPAKNGNFRVNTTNQVVGTVDTTLVDWRTYEWRMRRMNYERNDGTPAQTDGMAFFTDSGMLNRSPLSAVRWAISNIIGLLDTLNNKINISDTSAMLSKYARNTLAGIAIALGFTPADAANVYSKTASDAKYYLATNPNGYTSFDGVYSSLTGKPIIPAAQVQSDWNAVSGLGAVLNKPTIPTVSGASGTYGLTSVSNGLVTSGKRQELYSGTTNGSGVYTVTFGTAFSVAPNIQASIPAQSATNQYLRISSVSTTGFTVNAYSFNTNTLLGIVSIISTTSPLTSLPVDVIVTEK